MFDIEEVKRKLDPQEIIDTIQKISGGNLVDVQSVLKKRGNLYHEGFFNIKQDEITNQFTFGQSEEKDGEREIEEGNLFVINKVMKRIQSIVEYIRFPEYSKEMQEVFGEINRAVRYARHYSILSPDIEFCQKHSIFTVKTDSEFAFALPFHYRPVTLNGSRIISSVPSKKLYVVIPCYSAIRSDVDSRKFLCYYVNRENIRITTSGGRSFRTYNSFYYRGQMRVHIGETVWSNRHNENWILTDPRQIVEIRDAIQDFLNDIRPDLVGGIPKGYPEISSIVVERREDEEESISVAESENGYVAELIESASSLLDNMDQIPENLLDSNNDFWVVD